MTNQNLRTDLILGQKAAFAMAALLTGITSYVSLLGMEKGILAVIFGVLALKAAPAPRLVERRGWAWTGVLLGAGMIVLVPVLLLLFQDQVRELITALEKLQ